MTKEKIIFLNGTSSSGKTTIAKSLQEELDELYARASLDVFLHQLPDKFLDDHQKFSKKLPELVHCFQSSVAAQAHAGMNVILDHVLENPAWLDDCLCLFSGIEVLFVAVKCPLAELERREGERGDRHIGLARYQYERVHAHRVYDLELDTSILSVEQCVEAIAERVNLGGPASAFDILQVRKNINCREDDGTA